MEQMSLAVPALREILAPRTSCPRRKAPNLSHSVSTTIRPVARSLNNNTIQACRQQCTFEGLVLELNVVDGQKTLQHTHEELLLRQSLEIRQKHS